MILPVHSTNTATALHFMIARSIPPIELHIYLARSSMTGLWLPNIPNFDGVELAQVSQPRHGNQYLV